MDEEARHVKCEKATRPKNQQNNRQNQKHIHAFQPEKYAPLVRAWDHESRRKEFTLYPRANVPVGFRQDNNFRLLRIYVPGIPSEDVLELIVIIILVLLLFGSFPVFPYSRSWGYAPTGTLGTILLIVVILFLLHVI